MSGKDYAAGVLLAYEGEVRGEMTFAEMVRNETDPQTRRIWQLVTELETVTKRAIEPVARRLHGPLDGVAELASVEGARRAAERRGRSGLDIARAYVPLLPEALARFEKLETLAPKADQAVMRQLSDHSRAFGSCIRAWVEAGDPAEAGAPIERYLQTYAPGAAT